MKTKDIPSTLTPATIELIERDATARYGIRLRYLPPEEEPDAQVELEPTEAPSTSKGKKPPPKVTKEPTKPVRATTQEQKRLAILAKKGEFRAVQTHVLWTREGVAMNTASTKAGELLKKMVDAGQLVRQGNGRGTTYTVAPPKPTKAKESADE